ncbi:BamA/TamA family outer membrane protein [Roseovarius aquimarinus]|uniref:BamA/TamA family outer membrane protein n=1 Tax=Roseovarius aquimarinus TaxID=1229156 RepID=A0ABW7I668_9RHOB
MNYVAQRPSVVIIVGAPFMKRVSVFAGAAVLSILAAPGLSETLHDVAVAPDESPESAPEKSAEPLVELGASLGYNTELGVVAGARVGTDRLFGRNQSLDLTIEASEETLRYSAQYAAPDLFGEQPSFGLRLFAAQVERGDVFDFDSNVLGVEPRLTWKLDEGLSVSTFATFSWGEIDNLRAGSSNLIRKDVGTRAQQVIGVDVKRRKPGKGGALRGVSYGLGLEAGHSDMGHDYLSLSARYGAGWVAGAEDNVLLKMQLRGSAIASLDGTSHIGDRTFLGQSSLRGFAFGGIGPRDLSVATQPALGGNYSTTAQFDAQFRDAFDAVSERITPGVFVDFGSLWGLDDTRGGVAGGQRVDDGFNLRASGGVTFRLDTGMGPILLSIAQPILKESYDEVQEFSISYQTSF